MIKLGDRVKDVYTGFVGIADGRSTYLHGCDRITIEPETLDKDNKVREPESFDETRVELVDPGVFWHTSERPPLHIKLGDRVKDTITGFEGIAVSYGVWLHHSSMVGIEPTKLKDGKICDSANFAATRVKLVKSQPVLVAVASDTDKTGGPQDSPTRGPKPV